MTTATRAHRLLSDALGFEAPVRIRLWNGQEAGPVDAPVAVINSKRAIRHILYSPGELGVARAYVQGDLDVEGDLADSLRAVWSRITAQRAANPSLGKIKLGPKLLARGALSAISLGAIGRRPKPPAAESSLTGELHSTSRDQAAISHHYDLSNDLYELLLDDTMAYSCGFHYTPDLELGDAQRAKLDLICRKLDLKPGMKLVDIGSGWGSLTLHAAEHFGVYVTGVTLSHEQRDFVLRRAADRGLKGQVDVSLRHYRELNLPDASVDAIASVEMGEHVGDAEYVDFTQSIARYLKAHGRVLIQQMSRNNDHPGGGPFIETYIAPDMHMKPLHRTLEHITNAGLEIRDVQALREHYPQTVAAWSANLEENWDRAVALVGEETSRVWRLYLAGGALAFEQNRMGVDQILATKPGVDGSITMPATPAAWLR